MCSLNHIKQKKYYQILAVILQSVKRQASVQPGNLITERTSTKLGQHRNA